MKTHARIEQALRALRETDPRAAAEHAYALAVLHKQDGNTRKAVRFGKEALRLFDGCRMETAEDCAPQETAIGGVLMPSSFIHQKVVRSNLRPLRL